MHDVLTSGNAWAKDASLIIAVHSKEEDDCIIHDRKYYHFDTGLATAFLILRATELGLVAHPIAGYSPKKTRDILDIPDNHSVITLVIVGKHADVVKPVLSEKQAIQEVKRPSRHPLSQFVSMNRYGETAGTK
jgi:nitroreductase